MSLMDALFSGPSELGSLINPRPQSPFGPLSEPELPESEWRAAAWANLPGTGYVKTTEEGHPVSWFEYGNRNAALGWEVDHRTPRALGGRSTRSNLIARQWRANASAGSDVQAILRVLRGD